ncbi:MAG: AAA family ATPase [Desulfuromonadales bacterium]|nr:AAA family ATPase [Desulfuromonadales bacterium]
MKIKRLDLKAYGHFTDRSLDFRSDSPGLHIVYGPNEAGKSTALRALLGLLYGIDARTPDNFLHEYGQLLIGGHLENADGKELTFWRRKKNKGDLQDVDHNMIDQGVLAEFLHGIEEPLFKALFGIDHESLVTGGRDILEQKGDIGQALFSAGAGLSALHGIIESMDKECDDLFKGSASKPELNQAIRAYQDIKKKIRHLALSSTDWQGQREIFDTASRELEKIDEQKGELSAELERLKRLQRATHYLVKRVALREQLKSLGNFSHLPADFSERLQTALARQRQVDKSLQEARSRQHELEGKRAGATFSQEILDQSETIDALHQGLGVQRQAAHDRPQISNQLIECRTRAEALLNLVAPSLNLSQTGQLKDLLARRKTILPLGNRFAGIEQALTEAGSRFAALGQEQNRLQTQLETLPEVGDLRGLNAAVTAAQRAGDLDAVLRTLERDARELLVNATTDLQQIGLWTGPLEALLLLPLPSTATIDMFVEQYREAGERQRQKRREREDVQDELDRNRRDIDAIKRAGAVATEEDLSQARRRRDQGWQLVKRAWLGGETLEKEISDYDKNHDLPSAFEHGMLSADEISDQLRSAADRLHQYASLLAEVEKLEQQQQRLNKDAAEIATQKEQLELKWQTAWEESTLPPRSPREMRTWIDQCQEIRRNLREGKQKETEKQLLIEQRRRLGAALIAELKKVGQEQALASDELSPVLVYAEQALAELKTAQDQRQSVQMDEQRNRQEIDLAGKALSAARQAMNDWREEWASALHGFGLPADVSTEDAANALETLRSCLEKVTEIEGYQQRLQEIDQHAQTFDESVRSLVQSIAPDLGALTSGQAVVKLQAMVRDAEKAKSVLAKLDEDLEATREEIRQSGVDLNAVERELAALRELACCATDDEMTQVDARFRERQATEKALTELEDVLTGIAEGIGLDLLEEQRQDVDPNELPGRIEGLSRQIAAELEPQIKALAEKKGAAFNELQKMDGSGEAAAMEDAAQAALAKVRRLADRYLRVRLGSQLLKKEIERYRQENQDPILKMASRYFAELTLGSFPGLRSDLDDRGNPILVGVCPDGRTRTVEGMSSGTRDQLYLALRLATLEWRLEKHEAMPFIADDILVNFDDARSEATLKALAELAKKNQVILFTHHRQIVETVKALDIDGDVVVHPLDSSRL